MINRGRKVTITYRKESKRTQLTVTKDIGKLSLVGGGGEGQRERERDRDRET